MAIPVYPVFFHLAAQPVLVVGGGNVALRKVRSLLEAQARITVISPEFHGELAALAGITLRTESYCTGSTGHLSGADQPRWKLVFAATNQPDVNAQVTLDAGKSGIPCSRCDLPDDGDFSGASVWRHGSLVLAVGTGGASPLLASKICQDMADRIDPSMLELCTMMEQWRPRVLAEISEISLRTALLRRLAGEIMQETIRKGGRVAGQSLFEIWLAEMLRTPPREEPCSPKP